MRLPRDVRFASLPGISGVYISRRLHALVNRARDHLELTNVCWCLGSGSGFEMSPAAAFHTQLASIMEVLANTAVAEICDLVDSGYSVLQLEISRGRKENELLRRKLRLMELRAARTSALRALSGGGLAAIGGRARAPVPGHHGDQPRRARAPRGNIRVTLVHVETYRTQTKQTCPHRPSLTHTRTQTCL